MKRRLIVSNHSNLDLEWLTSLKEYGFTSENIYIYDKTPDDYPDKNDISHLGKIFKSPNVGYNQYDIGKYIVQNYDDLADINIFIKGNGLAENRHYTTWERFTYALQANWYVPIGPDPIGTGKFNPFENVGERCYINDWCYIEETKWFMNGMTGDPTKLKRLYPRIKSYKEFLEDLFLIGRIPEYVSFCPASQYAVPKQNILKYSKNFYKKMVYYNDYTEIGMPNAANEEAHFYERTMGMIWEGCLRENPSFQVPNDYIIK